MTDRNDPTDLIGALTADLSPVKRVMRPAMGAAAFVVASLVVAVVTVMLSHFPALPESNASLGMWLDTIGAVATSWLAALAAWQISMPDRSRRWALLPLPGVLLWLGSSLIESLTVGEAGSNWGATLAEALQCVRCIMLAGAPLIVFLILMLRRSAPLDPGLVAGLAGLACAGAGAAVLGLVHPHHPALLDLVLHTAALGVLVGAAYLLGRFAFRPRKMPFEAL
jgi:hypothetical protein